VTRRHSLSHGRRVRFQLAEVAVSGQMFADMLPLIVRLRAPPAPASRRVVRREATTGEMCLDAAKAARFSASA
jgi:hypothetical protein